MRRPALLLAAAVAALSLEPAAALEKLWYKARLEALGFEVPDEPRAAPDIRVEALSGGQVSLSSLKGKIVLLNFWATWCPPCRAEMPSIQNLWAKTKSTGRFAVMAVSLGEAKGTVSSFVERNGFDFPIYLDPRGRAGDLYGARSIPTTLVIDKTGAIIARAVGSREYDSPAALEILTELALR